MRLLGKVWKEQLTSPTSHFPWSGTFDHLDSLGMNRGSNLPTDEEKRDENPRSRGETWQRDG